MCAILATIEKLPVDMVNSTFQDTHQQMSPKLPNSCRMVYCR